MSSLNLNEYVEDGNGIYEIHPTATNNSGCMYDPVRNTIWTISNGGEVLREFPRANPIAANEIRSVQLSAPNIIDPDSASSGVNDDTEGLCYMGEGVGGGPIIGISSENRGSYVINVIHVPLGTTDIGEADIDRQATYWIAARETAASNSGLEGICYDIDNGIWYGVGEGEQEGVPRKFFKVVRPTNTTTDYNYHDAELVVTEPFDPEVNFQLLGATGSQFDLSGITFDQETGNVVIVSHRGSRLIGVNPADGTVYSELLIPPDGDYNQLEGVTFLDNGDIFVLSEPRNAKIYIAPTPPPSPVITQPPHAEIAKNSTFTYTPSLSAGETDGMWFKEYGPDTLTVDPQTGEISWDTSNAVRGQGFRITLGYCNDQGQDLKTFILHVDESGTSKIVLLGTVPAGSFPRTTSEYIRIGAEEAGFNGGDTLIVPDGFRYTSISGQDAFENSWQNTNFGNLPSGSSTQMTTIASDGLTIISSEAHDGINREDEGFEAIATQITDALLTPPTYVKFLGLEWTGTNRQAIRCTCPFVVFELCGATDCGYAQNPTTFAEADDAYGSVAAGYIGANAVWENCYAFGQFRYGLQFGNTVDSTLAMRCIVRPDEYHGDQPRGGITHYATSNSGCFSNWVIDADQEHLTPFYKNYAGAFALPATGNESFPFNQIFNSNGVVNCDMVPFTADGNAATCNLDVKDLLLVDVTNTITPQTGSTSPMGFRSAHVTTLERFSMTEARRYDGATTGSGLFISASDSDNTMTVTKAVIERCGWDGNTENNIGSLVGAKVGASGSTLSDSNIYNFVGTLSVNNFPATTAITNLNPRTNGWSYPPRVEEGSPLALAGQGANLERFANPSNVMPNDTGWLSPTTKWAWPHPEEELIASRMRTYSKSGLPVRNASVGVNPTDFTGTITGNRGFAHEDESFSEYIWGQFGVTVPPLRVAAKATSGGEVTFYVGRYRSENSKTISKYNVYNVNDLTTPIASFTGTTGRIAAQAASTETFVIRAVDPSKLSAWGANEVGESGNSEEMTVTITEFTLPAVNVIGAEGIGSPNVFPMFPIPDKTLGAGARILWINSMFETTGGAAITGMTVGGQAVTLVEPVRNDPSSTFSTLLGYILEADIPNIADNSVSYTGASPGGSSGFCQAVCVENTDNTTPYTNVEDVGFDGATVNTTQDATFTLDPTSKGLGLAFVGCSSAAITPAFGSSGYSQTGVNTVNGSNNAGFMAIKTFGDTNEPAETVTLQTGVAGGKTAVSAVMINSGAPVPSDDQVDEFAFTDQTGVSVSTLTESNELTITGIDVAVTVSVINGEYSIDGAAYTSADGTITAGQKLKLRVTSSASNDTSVSVLITVGQHTDFWSVTTVGLASDSTPNPFTFTDATNAALTSVIESNDITISDINQLVDIDITGDPSAEYRINGGAWTSSAGTGNVANGDVIRVRLTSSGSNNTTSVATLTVGGVTDTFSVTTIVASDTTPDAFDFTDQTNVAVSTAIESNTITVSGITADASISVTAGEWRKNGGSYQSAAGTVANGDTVQLRITSSAVNSTQSSITTNIGGVVDLWTITTEAAVSDTVPDAFDFIDQTDVAVNTAIESASLTISGINAPSPISVTAGEWRKNGGSYQSAAGTVNNGDLLQLRLTSSANNSTASSITTDIGGVTDLWTITTEPPVTDTTPDSFAFTDQTDIGLNSIVESNTITVAGIDAPTTISVTDGEWRKNGGSYQSAIGTVVNGDTVQLRMISSSANNTAETTTVDIGGVTDVWSITTETLSSDTTPEQFVFSDQVGVAVSTLITSDSITVQGINSAAAISVTGGTYSVNGGAFTSAAGTVNNSDTVRVQLTSSAANNTLASATLTIGGVSDIWSVTTVEFVEDTTPNIFSFTDQVDINLNTQVISNTITVTGINAPTPISVIGGEYSVNGGAFTNSPTNLNNNDTVRLRLTSSGSNSTQVTSICSIGGISDTWSLDTLDSVVDTVKPVITLIGAATITLNVGDTYSELGAVVTDNVDSGLTVNISGTVNTSLAGTYTLNYNVSDNAGNAADQVSRTVNVVSAGPATIDSAPTVIEDAEQGITVETSNMGVVTSVRLTSEGISTNGVNLNASLGTVTFGLPDLSALTTNQVGCPFSSTNNVVQLSVSDGTNTVSQTVVYNPKTNKMLTELTSPIFTEGSVLENVPPADAIDGSQVVCDAPNYVTANGTFKGDDVAGITYLRYWSKADRTWKRITRFN